MAFLQINYFSDTMIREVSVNAFVPEDLDSYKTLYLLHGLSDNHTAWQRYTNVELWAKNAGIAVVMPNVDRSFYTDTATGERFFTFYTEELPRVMRCFFKGMSADRNMNYIAGLSMGGYGALKAALTYPDRYAACCSLSGALDIPFMIDSYGVARKEFYENIFGNTELVKGSANDLRALLEKQTSAGAVLPEIFLACGTEDRILPCSRRFLAACREFGVEPDYKECPGNHNWVFWGEHIKPFIDHIAKM